LGNANVINSAAFGLITFAITLCGIALVALAAMTGNVIVIVLAVVIVVLAVIATALIHTGLCGI